MKCHFCHWKDLDLHLDLLVLVGLEILGSGLETAEEGATVGVRTVDENLREEREERRK